MNTAFLGHLLKMFASEARIHPQLLQVLKKVNHLHSFHTPNFTPHFADYALNGLATPLQY